MNEVTASRRAVMRQIAIVKTGSKDAFQVQKTTISDPAGNEVMIRVKAIGINFDDVAEAHAYVEGRKNIGKVVLKVD